MAQGYLIFLGVALLLLMVVIALSASAQEWIEKQSKWSGNLAQMASAVIAAIGFATVIVQLNDNRAKSAEEAFRAEKGDARRVYMSYSEAALRYPELAQADYGALVKSPIEFVRYTFFVGHMLYAYDEILWINERAAPDDYNEWRKSFEIDLEPHMRYLCQITDTRFFEQFRPSMQSYLANARGHCNKFSQFDDIGPG